MICKFVALLPAPLFDEYSSTYVVPVLVGEQELSLQIDTGSSDLVRLSAFILLFTQPYFILHVKSGLHLLRVPLRVVS